MHILLVQVMFGDAGHGTGFHFDWARAVNLAVGVLVDAASVASGAAIALWLFIPPTEAAFVNLRACIKIAYDFVLATELGIIALVQHLLHSKFSSQNNADDYVGIGNKLHQEAKTFVHNNS